MMLAGCGHYSSPVATTGNNSDLAALFQRYFDKRMELFPIEATANGDNRFNDKLAIDFTDSYIAVLKEFYEQNLHSLQAFDMEKLNIKDQASYDVFKYELTINLEGLVHHYMMDLLYSQNSFTP
ncbi:MAG TPA: hypothetical protein VGO47_04420, partial [Chlamydiales bacterium]|nr:hypothetical protein [Chlamydiales bacterium]